MKMISALLVVQEPSMRQRLSAVVEKQSRLQIDLCADPHEVLALLNAGSIQILYCDVHLDGISGIELVKQAKQQFPELHILVGSANGTAKDVIDAMQAGASDFLVDPNDPDLIATAFDKATRDLLKNEPCQSRGLSGTKAVITQDKALLSVLDIAKKVAPSQATILINGESGTGKELLAAFIHRNSQRDDKPYLAINCAALPDQLAESELFGHEKGAFTGALTRKIGKFEDAGQGSLVLDEITEMALPLQAKLLRALQEREIVRLGGNRPIPVEARVIAISNRDMQQTIASGNFREDLFYRLNVIPLTIPPLRQRKNDIPLLADYFLKRFSTQNGSTISCISNAALDLLMKQSWPGNVRELENTIQRGVLIGTGEALRPEHLILEASPTAPQKRTSVTAGMTVRDMEKELIYNTLQSVNDNRTHAAKMLGISIRTLRNKLNEYRDENEVARR